MLKVNCEACGAPYEVDPRRVPATFHSGRLADATALLADGVAITDGTVHADGFGYGIFALSGG